LIHLETGCGIPKEWDDPFEIGFLQSVRAKITQGLAFLCRLEAASRDALAAKFAVGRSQRTLAGLRAIRCRLQRKAGKEAL